VNVNIDRSKTMLGVAVVLALCGGIACSQPQPEQAAPEQEQAAADSPVNAGPFEITLDTGGPLKMTAAPLDVTVHENGKPAADVEVSVELRMPPSGAMGEMRTGAELKPGGDGHYRGEVDMMMAGKWNAIVRVKRGGQVVATHTQPVTAE
jgi:hypothetical protein